TPTGTIVHTANRFTASWSPNGNRIVFGGQSDVEHAGSIFVVNADGRDLHQVPIPGCGTLRSEARLIRCYDPVWSPDGTRIVFARGRGNSFAIYTVNADGTGLARVTTATNGFVSAPDWGTHPVIGRWATS